MGDNKRWLGGQMSSHLNGQRTFLSPTLQPPTLEYFYTKLSYTLLPFLISFAPFSLPLFLSLPTLEGRKRKRDSSVRAPPTLKVKKGSASDRHGSVSISALGFQKKMTMVESSFDWWQKDMFFSAAEEVQQSADIMESVYRTWERERRDRFQSDDLEELGRELLTALGITKWQLEEFDKAVKLSHQKCSGENTIARHRQFVVAIETQVSRVEKALGDSRIEEGKQPLRWVQLDEDERDDLALFLTGPAGTSEESKGSVDFDASSSRMGTQSIKDYKEIVTINQDAKYVVELAAKELPKLKEEMQSPREPSNGKTTIWNSPDIGAWKISIADEDAHKSLEATPKRQPLCFNISNLLRYIKLSTKSNWCRNSFRKAKSEEDLNVKTVSSYVDFRGVRRLTRLFGQVGGFRREVDSSQCYMKFSRSLQVTLVLILTFFLIVPFMIYVS